MTIRLGATPEDLEVVLVAGQSWAVSLARKDATTGTPVDWTDRVGERQLGQGGHRAGHHRQDR